MKKSEKIAFNGKIRITGNGEMKFIYPVRDMMRRRYFPGENNMRFDYKSYIGLLKKLKNNGYVFADYHNYDKFCRCVILRHDIDCDLNKALELSRLEAEFNNGGGGTLHLFCPFKKRFLQRRIGLLKKSFAGHYGIGP